MVGAKEAVTSVGAVGAGVGSTLLIRQQLDAANETTVFRPSVLWGVGTGALGLGASMFMGNGRNGAVMEFVEDYSEAAIAAGLTSAFVSGGGVQLPTV